MSKKLPSFQFYPGDWRKDANLSRCSKAAKGVWMDMLCLMFECDTRGVLSTNDEPWSDQEIAAAVGGDTAEVLSCIRELLTKCVARRNAQGAIMSRRLVRDEQIRAARESAGRAGAAVTNGLGKTPANGPAKDAAKPQQPPEGEDEAETEDEKENANEAALQLRTLVSQVFEHYKKYHPKWKSGEKFSKLVKARAREGYDGADLMKAIDGCHRSPYHCGENKDGKKYQTFDLIFRDADKVNQFIEAADGAGPVLSEKTRRNLRAGDAWLEGKLGDSGGQEN